MSATIWISPSIQSLQRRKPFDFTPSPVGSPNPLLSSYFRIRTDPFVSNTSILQKKFHVIYGRITSLCAASVEGLTQDFDSPIPVQLQPIVDEAQFDQILSQTRQPQEAVIILWMANWCRKCIYLKPKLEKLAAEYRPRIRFYCIDVNKVPHRLVSRAGVTLIIVILFHDLKYGTPTPMQKMPTIQLWKEANKQAEVIGGHQAYLVVNEIRAMIEDEYSV